MMLCKLDSNQIINHKGKKICMRHMFIVDLIIHEYDFYFRCVFSRKIKSVASHKFDVNRIHDFVKI